MADGDWTPGALGVCNQFWEMREKSVLTDCTFLIGPEQTKVHAHKLVLARASSALHAMLFGPLAEKGDIKILDADTKIFIKFLKFVYCDNVEIKSCRQAIELCYMAHRYLISNFTQFCVDFLSQNLNIYVFWRVFELANLLDNSKLKDSCMEMLRLQTIDLIEDSSFVNINREDLMLILQQDHLNIHEIELKLVSAVIRWGHAHKDSTHDSVKDVIGPDIIKLFRFLTFKPKECACIFFQSGIITQEEKVAILANICEYTDYPLPDTISKCKDIRKIDTLITEKHLLSLTLNSLPQSLGSLINTGEKSCILSFSPSKSFWLQGVEFFTRKTFGRKRKLNDSSNLGDDYNENIAFFFSKITKQENSNLETSQMLVKTNFTGLCFTDSTATIKFEYPVFIESSALLTYKIKMILNKEDSTGNTIFYHQHTHTVTSSKYRETELSLEYGSQENATIFVSLLFYSPFNISSENDSSDDETELAMEAS